MSRLFSLHDFGVCAGSPVLQSLVKVRKLHKQVVLHKHCLCKYVWAQGTTVKD